jgi:hypothetical protein
MGEGQGQERAQQLSDDPDEAAAQLRTEIEEVREDLGDTAAALAAKTDVKARAREKAEELKRSASAKKDDLLGGRTGSGGSGGGAAAGASSGLAQVRTKASENPVPTAALGALVGGFLLGRLTRRGP